MLIVHKLLSPDPDARKDTLNVQICVTLNQSLTYWNKIERGPPKMQLIEKVDT